MSKYFFFSLVIIALLVGLIGGYALSSRAPVSDSAKEMDAKTETQVAGLYSDQQFLQDMIMHHEDAISMSKRVLTHTSRKEVRELAANIIEVQSREIEQMKQWISEWK